MLAVVWIAGMSLQKSEHGMDAGNVVFLCGICGCLGIAFGLWLGYYLDQRDVLYSCPRCLRNKMAAAMEEDETATAVRQIFKDQAVTIAVINDTVHVICNSREDSEFVFNWLEHEICKVAAAATAEVPGGT